MLDSEADGSTTGHQGISPVYQPRPRCAAPLQVRGDVAFARLRTAMSGALDELPASEVEWGILLERIAAGDDTALGPLYDGTSAIVHGVALHLLGDAGAAEDVTAETYLQIWQRAADFDAARGRPSTWLRTVARSRAIDRLRQDVRRRRLRQELLEEQPVAIESDAPDPAHLSESLERRRAARDALAALPEDQREVIMLAYFSGLSQREISERLAQPLGTVKSRVRLGMTRLRDVLGERID